MGYGNFVLEAQSPGWCYSTEENNERQNAYTNITDEKSILVWFYLPYCEECEKYREFVNIKCSHHRSHRLLLACIYCQNNFKTFNDRKVKCSPCCSSTERKLKTYTFEKSKKQLLCII